MPSYRYYKLHAVTIPGGGYLEIGDFNLMASGARVAGGTLTASDTPTNSLAYFDDGSTSQRCYWTETTAEGAGFYVQWDFGTATTVDGCRFCGFDTSTRYPSGFTISGSADGTNWTTLGTFSGIAYPGNQVFTSVLSLASPVYLSGTVLDDAGSPCARTVRAYRRDTGALIGSTTSNATTGAWSIQGIDGVESQIVCLDDGAGTTHNDLIHRATPV